MDKVILSVVAIIAIAAMLGVSSVAPVYAAKKTIDINTTEFRDDLTQRRICGESLVDVERTIKDRVTIWDNDKFKMHKVVAKKFFDRNTGELIGHSITVFNFQGTMKDEPQSFQSNASLICLNGAPNSTLNSGATLHKDGTTTLHNE